MGAPERFGYEDVVWRPSVYDDPREVIASYLQHRVVLEVRRRNGQASIRDLAACAGVGKSTMARWLAGQELLNMSGLAALAAAFGVAVLDGIAGIEAGETIALLPEPYRPLAAVRNGRLVFGDVAEPAWAEFTAALTDAVQREHRRGRGHLLSSAALAWMLACAADELPPTRGLVDLGDSDSTVVEFALDRPVAVTVAQIVDDRASRMRTAILSALVGTMTERRRVVALVLGARGATVLDQLGHRREDGEVAIASVTLARAGVGNPIDPDVVVVERGRVSVEAGTVVLLEPLKSPAGPDPVGRADSA